MKVKTKFAVIATAAVVAVPVAHAATEGYWTQHGSSYKCEGLSDAVICKDNRSGYSVTITQSYVAIFTGKSNVVYGCKRSTHQCVEG